MTARDFENRTSAVPFNGTARAFQKPVSNPGFDEIEFLVGTALSPAILSSWSKVTRD